MSEKEILVYEFYTPDGLFFSRRDETADEFVIRKIDEGVPVRVIASAPAYYRAICATESSAAFFKTGD